MANHNKRGISHKPLFPVVKQGTAAPPGGAHSVGCPMPSDGNKDDPTPWYPDRVHLQPGETIERFRVPWSRKKAYYVYIVGRWFQNYRNTGKDMFVFSERIMDAVMIVAATTWSYNTVRDKSWCESLPAQIILPKDDSRAAVRRTKKSTRRPARKILCDTQNFFVWLAAHIRKVPA